MNDKQINEMHTETCSCGCQHHHEHDSSQEETALMRDLIKDSEDIVQLVDEETGETYDFAFADQFEFEDKVYAVLVTLNDDPAYVIASKVEVDGEVYIETLPEEDEDSVYDEYARLLSEEFNEAE